MHYTHTGAFSLIRELERQREVREYAEQHRIKDLKEAQIALWNEQRERRKQIRRRLIELDELNPT